MPRAISLEELVRRFNHTGPEVERALRRVAPLIAKRLTESSRQVLQLEVYDIPVKVDSRGIPRWIRTRHLIDSERFIVGPNGMDVLHINEAPYWMHRFRYGKGGHRANPPQQASSWFQTAILREGRWVHKKRHQAVLEGLRAVRRV